jgi:malate dehydrogenase (oxaloacetate-decarboxylating)
MAQSSVRSVLEMDPVEAHAMYRKFVTLPACPVEFDTLKTWYTPGVADPCREIMRDQENVWKLTGRSNRIAVVSDGTRILGLRREGVYGAEASLPVMEGKALLFRVLGGIDAIPVVLGWRDAQGDVMHIPSADEIVSAVKMMQSNFAGINLEDIEAEDDKCFKVLDQLRGDSELHVPVWHDDQQGTATVVLAAVINALELADKKRKNVQVVCVGSGAAMLAILRLLVSWGIQYDQIRLLDSKGSVDEHRDDIDGSTQKGDLKSKVQQLGVMGDKESKEVAMKNADMVIMASTSRMGGIIDPELVAIMNDKPVVMALANPYPEIDPVKAKENGAFIVGTGRSDFSNQINNSLVFPGIFRGVLDSRARTITDSMAISAAHAVADRARKISGFGPDKIMPKMDDLEMVCDIAYATARQATKEGLAQIPVNEGDEKIYKDNVRKLVTDVGDMVGSVLKVLY